VETLSLRGVLGPVPSGGLDGVSPLVERQLGLDHVFKVVVQHISEAKDLDEDVGDFLLD